MVGPDRTLAYGELRSLVGSLRGGLADAGVRPGDRVALALGNDWPFAVAYLAVLGAGAVAVPLDPTLPVPALEAELSAVGVTAAFVGPTAVESFSRLLSAGGAEGGADSAGAPAGSGAGAAGGAGSGAGGLRLVVAAPGAESVPGATPMAELSHGPAGAVVEREPDDPAALIFTAGTAGAPKAAILTHGSLRSNLDQVQQHPGRALVPADVSFGVLPLFHVFGLNVVLGLSFLAGASVLMVERFDAEAALKQIPAAGVTLLAGAPPMFSNLAAAGEDRPRALDGIRLAVSGASALSAEVAAAFEARFGLPLWQGYGLTEASPVVTSSVIGGVVKPGSIGVPVPGVEVRIVDEDGEDAFVGDSGELWIKGPNVFGGYWEDPEATRAVIIPDGWLRTGDVAVADDDGYLYLVDRSKDLIIVSGFNVFPAEVEEVLASHPGVAEVAVVGDHDAHSGESVHAYVVLEEGASPDQDELRQWCRDRLARYKCPTDITLVEALPHGLGGKLLRRALRGPGDATP